MRLRNAHLVTFRLCKILHGWKVTGWAFLSGERGREEKHALKKNILQLFASRKRWDCLHIFLLSVVVFYAKLLSVALVFMDFILYSLPQGGVVMNINPVENNNRIDGVMNHRMNSQSDREKGIPQQVGNILLAHGSNSAEGTWPQNGGLLLFDWRLYWHCGKVGDLQRQ